TSVPACVRAVKGRLKSPGSYCVWGPIVIGSKCDRAKSKCNCSSGDGRCKENFWSHGIPPDGRLCERLSVAHFVVSQSLIAYKMRFLGRDKTYVWQAIRPRKHSKE